MEVKLLLEKLNRNLSDPFPSSKTFVSTGKLLKRLYSQLIEFGWDAVLEAYNLKLHITIVCSVDAIINNEHSTDFALKCILCFLQEQKLNEKILQSLTISGPNFVFEFVPLNFRHFQVELYSFCQF
jgi:hypothetical protein